MCDLLVLGIVLAIFCTVAVCFVVRHLKNRLHGDATITDDIEMQTDDFNPDRD